jgi:IPT/TIG domain
VEEAMQRRAWLGLLSAVGVGACGKDHTLVDGGSGGGSSASGGGGQVKVRGVTPPRGPLAGGTNIIIDGQGFTALDAGAAIVVIGERQASNVTVVDDFTVTATVPPGAAPDAFDVLVANRNGYGGLDKGFTYNPIPTITKVDPARGDAGGGTAVTITGTGFQQFEPGSNRVTVGDLLATNVVVVSDTQLTATTPPGPAFRAVDVAVSNQNGSAAPDAKAYLYTAKGLVVGPAGQGSAINAFFYLDPGSGLLTKIMDATDEPVKSSGLHSMAQDGQGKLWGTTRGATPHLVTIDLYSYTITDVAPVTSPTAGGPGKPGPLDCHDLEFVGTTLYCTLQNRGPRVFVIDTATGIGTETAKTPTQTFELGLVAGTLYATWPCCPGRISTVDLDAGTVGTPINVTVGGNAFSSSVVKPTGLGSALYFVGRGNGSGGLPLSPNGGPSNKTIYRLDPTTGAATLIVSTPFATNAMSKFE